jgi:hypothetical protein
MVNLDLMASLALMDHTHQHREVGIIIPHLLHTGIRTTSSMVEAVHGAVLILLRALHRISMTIATMGTLPRTLRMVPTTARPILLTSTAPIPSLILEFIQPTQDTITHLALTHIRTMMRIELKVIVMETGKGE